MKTKRLWIKLTEQQLKVIIFACHDVFPSIHWNLSLPALIARQRDDVMEIQNTCAREHCKYKQAIFTKCFSFFYEGLVQSFPRCCYNHFMTPEARIYSKSIRKYSRTSMCYHFSPISDHLFKTPEFSFGAFCKGPPLVSKRPRESFWIWNGLRYSIVFILW